MFVVTGRPCQWPLLHNIVWDRKNSEIQKVPIKKAYEAKMSKKKFCGLGQVDGFSFLKKIFILNMSNFS